MSLAFSAANAAQWRGVVFIGLAAVFIAAESLYPDRPRELRRRARWPGNAFLVVLGAAVARFAPIGALAGAAAFAQTRGIGLFAWFAQAGAPIPVWVQWVLSLIALDFWVWLFHVGMHRIPGLWPLHRVHHADPDIDVTTALRFHPLEIAISGLFKAVMVIALGVPVGAAILFEIILNGLAMFNHANWRIGPRLDAALRLVLVTPASHRMHHAIEAGHNRNFGFCLSLWDRMFREWVPPSEDRAALHIGFPYFRGPRAHGPWALLAQPFRRPQVAQTAPSGEAAAGHRADEPRP